MRKLLIPAFLCPFIGLCQLPPVKGRIINQQMEPVADATIMVKRIGHTIASDAAGTFIIEQLQLADTIIISAVGYETSMVTPSRDQLTIILKQKTPALDDVVIIAYGTTSRRLNTGNVGRIRAEQISRQPVSNPLAALEARIPGLLITQQSGVPGAGFNVQLRGQSSIAQGTTPLFIIDGIPFSPGNTPANQIFSAVNNPRQVSQGGFSPLATINPSDIESIDVLKDADATAIYGSRGANGVIIISTKKGFSGKTRLEANLSTSFSRITRMMPMLNSSQYLQMRREAFANDGANPTIATAPDLLVWDTTRYTNFTDLLIGGTSRAHNASLSLSGGTASIKFLFGGNYHRETSVFPGNSALSRGTTHFNLGHSSNEQKFIMNFSTSYSATHSNLLKTDLTSFINLPPVYPSLYDSAGKLAWRQGGIAFINPLSVLYNEYHSTLQNLLSNLTLSYNPFNGFFVKASLGYNSFLNEEHSILPKTAIDPQASTPSSSDFATGHSKSWIIEPQAEYRKAMNKLRLSFLLGTTLQSVSSNSNYISASGYTTDALLGSIAGAANISASNDGSEYKYKPCLDGST